jgi:uncharacterized protein YqgV (UPF0045/DUF77 family)
MEKKKIIHIGIQVVPMIIREQAFPVIDQVIAAIAAHEFRYAVTPFETVVECSFEEAMQLLQECHAMMNQSFQGEYLINARFHIHTDEAVHWEDKVK